MPTARSMARAGALALPSVTSRLRGLRSAVSVRSSRGVTSGDVRPPVRPGVGGGVGGCPLVPPPPRLRMSRTALLPVAVLVVCAIPLAASGPWGPLVLLIPAAVAARVRRVGVDVGEDGIPAQSLFGRPMLPWSEVAGIRVARRGELWL